MLGIFFLLLNGVRHLIDQRKDPAFTSLSCPCVEVLRRVDEQFVLNGLRKKATAPLARARSDAPGSS